MAEFLFWSSFFKFIKDLQTGGGEGPPDGINYGEPSIAITDPFYHENDSASHEFLLAPAGAPAEDRVLSCILNYYDQFGLGPATSVTLGGVEATLVGTSPWLDGEDNPILDNHVCQVWAALVPEGETITMQIELPGVVPWIIGSLARITGCRLSDVVVVSRRDTGFPSTEVDFDFTMAVQNGTALHGMAGGDIVGVPSSGGWTGITGAANVIFAESGWMLPAASLSTTQQTRPMSFDLSGSAQIYTASGIVVGYNPA